MVATVGAIVEVYVLVFVNDFQKLHLSQKIFERMGCNEIQEDLLRSTTLVI